MPARLLGAHMSIEGGLFRALERGKSIRCRTIQLFTRNNTRWAAKDLSEDEVGSFKRIRQAAGINPVFAHCSYLINLAASAEFYQKSIDALVLEVQRAEQLGLDFVVLHPGAHMGKGEEEGLKRIADALNQVLARTTGAQCKIAIENTAGQGSCLGCSFEHLDYILCHVNDQERVGIVLDTCHLFVSGYDIRKKRTYEETFQKLADVIPFSKVWAFHLNDSKKPLNSRKDRHEHIGKGFLGKNAFRLLLHDPRFTFVPKVLETPKGKDLAEDVINLSLLLSL
jgi:deoxyribonuclease-4